MLWLLVACWSSPKVAHPTQAIALPAKSAAQDVRALDGVQRLFGGPFRCVLPDGTDVAFHPNGIARGEPDLRGNWRQSDGQLVVDARHEGVDVVYEWPFHAFARKGDWMLTTPTGALACRPGHDTEPGTAGPWLRILHAGGPAADAGRALVGAPGIALVVDGPGSAEQDGIVLRCRTPCDPMPVAQHVADRLGVAVATEARADIEMPYELVVGR